MEPRHNKPIQINLVSFGQERTQCLQTMEDNWEQVRPDIKETARARGVVIHGCSVEV